MGDCVCAFMFAYMCICVCKCYAYVHMCVCVLRGPVGQSGKSVGCLAQRGKDGGNESMHQQWRSVKIATEQMQ